MSNVRIDYGGVATGAKDDFVPAVSNKTDFTDLSQLTQDGLIFPNYGNPCELYTVPLDGSVEPMPTETEGLNFGWWTQKISTETGEFDTPIILILTADDLYTSSGITFTFDTINNIYSNYLYIKWYRDDELLSDMEFFPDSAFYYCENKVEFYNKLEITFYSINLSYTRLRLHAIDYGMKLSFFGEELKNAKISHEIDVLSTSLPINTCNFTIVNDRNINFTFEEDQTLRIYFNDELQLKCFVKKWNRKNKKVWDITAESYIGQLEKTDYVGRMCFKGLTTAEEVVAEISEISHVPIEISDELKNKNLSGHIPYSSCRDSLRLIAFALGAVVDDTKSETVKIYKLSEEIKQNIPLERIRQGQSFTKDQKSTSVELFYHSYTGLGELEYDILFETDENGDGNNLFYISEKPITEYKILGEGEIISSGVNYCQFNIGKESRLMGRFYRHNKSVKIKNDPLIKLNETPKTTSIKDATLINSDNVNEILDKLFGYYNNPNFVNLKIIEGKKEVEIGYAKYGEAKYGEALYSSGAKSRAVVSDPTTKVGDVIVSQTEYLGDVKGRIVKQTYTLNGNILVKESKLKRS